MAGGETYPFARVAELGLSGAGVAVLHRVLRDAQDHLGPGQGARGGPSSISPTAPRVTEVVIDRLTGENRILRVDVLHDTGSSLNPDLDIGQIEGAYVQGAGWLTTEELVWDGKGRLTTHAPSTYKIPAMGDRPRIFNVALWSKPNAEDTVGKSKAVGEPPFMLGISALHALSNAVAACGDGSIYPNLNAPATPERVLAAVKRQQSDV